MRLSSCLEWLKNRNRKQNKTRRPTTRRKSTVQLQIEALEARLAPATTDTWTGLADSNWMTVGNWSTTNASNSGSRRHAGFPLRRCPAD